jgi:predicted Zn-dependent protease
MKLPKIIANIAYFSIVLASINTSARADNVNRTATSTPARTQIAYLTPMVDLQHSRDAASSAYQAMQFASALPQYQNICQSTAANAKDYYWLGETYFHLNRFVEAAQTFEKALTIDPRMDGVRVSVVQSYLQANQPQIAKEKCVAALNIVTDPIARQELSMLEQYCHPHPITHVNASQHRGAARMVEN